MTAVSPVSGPTGASNRARYEPTLSDFTDHLDVIMDGLESLWYGCKTPEQRAPIVAVFKALHEYHDHDQEDEHCDPACPAWFLGAYCGNCGVRHRTIRENTDV